MPVHLCVFDTSWGPCGIAWTEAGISGLHLPGRATTAIAAELGAQFDGAVEAPPPPKVRTIIRRIEASFAGASESFSDVALDFSGAPEFHRKVWQAARGIPRGRTVTYGELASQLGAPGGARAVGQAMAKNRIPLIIPCHRVLAAGGQPGGFSAFGGLRTKEKLLQSEGVVLQPQGSLFGGLAFDARAAVKHLRAADPKLAAIIDEVGAFRLQRESMTSTFEALAESIVYQQLHAKAAAAIVERVQALYGGRFPSPQELRGTRASRLRKAGLSAGKLAAMRDLAEKALDGTVPDVSVLEILDDEAIVERLTRVRGIGRWTAEMLLIFRLGRPDVLPVTDYGVRKGFAVMLGKKEPADPKVMSRRGEQWRPFRTAASWYLWRATELER